MLNASAARSLEPELRYGEIAAGSYTRVDGHAEPQKVIDACIDHLSAYGADVHRHCRVAGLQMDGELSHGNRISEVSTICSGFIADSVVLAAGADTPELASMAGLRVPVHHSFGATIITESTEPIFRNVGVVHTPREVDPQINLRQFQDGSAIVHGGATDGSVGRTDAEVKKVVGPKLGFSMSCSE